MTDKSSLSAPKHLRAETRKWWQAVIAEYQLEAHHVRLLTLCGESWDRCQQARGILERRGLTYADRFGQPCARPEVAIERDSRIAFARLLRELNLNVDEPDDLRPPEVR